MANFSAEHLWPPYELCSQKGLPMNKTMSLKIAHFLENALINGFGLERANRLALLDQGKSAALEICCNEADRKVVNMRILEKILLSEVMNSASNIDVLAARANIETSLLFEKARQLELIAIADAYLNK